jgi:hypothetical protein
MRNCLIILSGLLFVFTGSAFAENCKTKKNYYGVSVTGTRYRKNVRHLMLAGKLKGDKKHIYEKYGFTFHRVRTNAAGRYTESWKYYDDGLEFVFDGDSNLIEERTITVEHRRDWFRR